MNKSNKVYVVIQKFTENIEREENAVLTSVEAVNKTKEGAVNALKKCRDDAFDAITGGDENETSRVSCDKPWDGTECVLESDTCQNWTWTIEENVLGE